MLTYDEALTASRFEHMVLKNADGTPLRARRNGKTQTWKTRPGQYRVPIKVGLYVYGNITDTEAAGWKAV